MNVFNYSIHFSIFSHRCIFFGVFFFQFLRLFLFENKFRQFTHQWKVFRQINSMTLLKFHPQVKTFWALVICIIFSIDLVSKSVSKLQRWILPRGAKKQIYLPWFGILLFEKKKHSFVKFHPRLKNSHNSNSFNMYTHFEFSSNENSPTPLLPSNRSWTIILFPTSVPVRRWKTPRRTCGRCNGTSGRLNVTMD